MSVAPPPLPGVGPAQPGVERDPLVAARTAFFTRAGAPAWQGPGAGPALARPGALACLLEAEYGPLPRLLPPGNFRLPGREDATVASLRRACRLEVPLTPDALLAHGEGGPFLAAVLTEMWQATVRRYGAAWAEEALRERLREAGTGAARTVLLLDLAEAAGLRPLGAAEAADAAARAGRAARHALWRYLHRLPEGPAHLPPVSGARDVHERLLLGPPPPAALSGWPEGGLVVAQTMLLGRLDRPGEGAGGGLSVLLGGLGDALAGTNGIGAVVTVVLAGRDDLDLDPRLLVRRRGNHWLLRLPVDAPTAPPQHAMPAHRPSLAWWATRLLRSLPRACDVVHARYADDGSLALAESAVRLGARLVFTATPDPHRRLAETHAGADDPPATEALRGDLHRIFLADRLVDRADTVIGIPGGSGTEDLLRHFPALAHRYGPDGPPAPPEGIAPYEPAEDERERRSALLDSLFAGGDRPDALDPADRDLPLLLCVGRLHPVKQQDLLLRTWLTADLWRRATLVMVGGATRHPTPDEHRVRAALGALVTGRKEAARRLALLPALPNDRVRRLERALADPEHGVRAWYVCPSAKEEFGIAVLEAMEAGLPAAGPLRGGVGHYLRDGVNGVLLDTGSASGLTRGLHRLLSLPESRRGRLARAGQETVAARYSIAPMAQALAGVYRSAGRT
ncbi:glycosyltransferase family 4 protein [Streptomyces toyocaensis]|uniref:glycosyltransferase family 4 protein n=1 Tax=Streptomyces toyocaensis TaxID=55952 RepID=UPI000A9FF4A1|nr:glycosyltransferase family 4 protein [Streptomyces toyocaensis]